MCIEACGLSSLFYWERETGFASIHELSYVTAGRWREGGGSTPKPRDRHLASYVAAV